MRLVSAGEVASTDNGRPIRAGPRRAHSSTMPTPQGGVEKQTRLPMRVASDGPPAGGTHGSWQMNAALPAGPIQNNVSYHATPPPPRSIKQATGGEATHYQSPQGLALIRWPLVSLLSVCGSYIEICCRVARHLSRLLYIEGQGTAMCQNKKNRNFFVFALRHHHVLSRPSPRKGYHAHHMARAPGCQQTGRRREVRSGGQAD